MKNIETPPLISRKVLFPFLLGITVLFISNVAVAQNKWSITFRPGVNFPTKDLGDADLKTGFGLEGTVAYRFMPHLGVYAGWSWNKFSAEQSFAGTDTDFEETGYSYGLQFIHPIGSSKVNYLLRGGGLYNHIETENKEGDIIADSGHGFGWDIETGVSIPLGERWQFAPGIRYRALSRDIEIGTTKTPVDLNYISVGVGLSWAFGK
jgi:hypothetical protein